MKARCTSEFNWIKKLQTPYLLGLNDNILHQENILNDPSIDIHFLIFVSESHVHMDVVKMVILNGEEESRLPFKIV